MQVEYAWVSQQELITASSVETLAQHDLLISTNIDNISPLEMEVILLYSTIIYCKYMSTGGGDVRAGDYNHQYGPGDQPGV